jgi:hypothetical protein
MEPAEPIFGAGGRVAGFYVDKGAAESPRLMANPRACLHDMPSHRQLLTRKVVKISGEKSLTGEVTTGLRFVTKLS